MHWWWFLFIFKTLMDSKLCLYIRGIIVPVPYGTELVFCEHNLISTVMYVHTYIHTNIDKHFLIMFFEIVQLQRPKWVTFQRFQYGTSKVFQKTSLWYIYLRTYESTRRYLKKKEINQRATVRCTVRYRLIRDKL